MKPEIRASLLRLYLARLPSLPAGDAEAVRAALGPDAIRQIERTPGHEWLPMAFEGTILRTLHAARGDDGAREMGRGVGGDAVRNGILRPLVSAVLGMLGRRPEALLQLAIAGWGLAVRNAGRMIIVSRAPSGVRIAYEGIPEGVRHRGHLMRCVGSLEGLLEYGGVDGRAELLWEEGAPTAICEVRFARARGGR